MRDTLAYLATHCHGDDRPDCPILADLAAVKLPAGGSPKKPRRAALHPEH